MSDTNDTNETNQENLLHDATGGKVDKILVTQAETEAALEFWKHFNIPIDPAMQEVFTRFCQNPTIKNQEDLKIEVCRAIGMSTHEAFQDDMMRKIVDECKAVYYDAQFDKDLEETLANQESK